MPWRRAAFASVTADLALLAFADIAYGTKDDVRIVQLLEGTITDGEPTPFIMYPNVLLGKGLKLLYNHFPDTPWYFLLLASALLLVHALFVALIAEKKGGVAALVLWLFFLPFLLRVTFTSVSILLTFAGFAALFPLLEVHKGFWGTAKAYVEAAPLFLLAVLIRPEAFFFASAAGMAALLCFMKPKRFFREILPWFMVAAFSAAAFPAVDFEEYRHSICNADFPEYNKYKSFLIDFGIAEHSDGFEEALKKAGWSRNDYLVFRNWLFLKNDTYRIERLKRFVESLKVEFSKKWEAVTRFGRDFAADSYPLLVILVIAGLLVGTGFGSLVRLSAFFLLLFLLLIGVAFLTKPPPPRLYLPLCYFALFVGIWNSDEIVSRRKRVFLAMVSVFLFFHLGYLIRQNRRCALLHRQALHALNPLDLYLVIDDALCPTGMDPRKVHRKEGIETVPFGTVMILDEVKERLASAGITGYMDLLDPRVRLLVRKESLWKIKLLLRYLREHGQPEAKARSRSIAPGLYEVWLSSGKEGKAVLSDRGPS